MLTANGQDPEVLAAFEGLYLAEGVKRASRARDMRRQEILKLSAKELDYVDPPAVTAAFDSSLACFDKILERRPDHTKAQVLRAGLLHMKKRDRDRTVGLLGKALQGNPQARDVHMQLRKVSRPCTACGDTGFCRRCHGRGVRQGFLSSGRCEDCMGQGTCRRCSIL